MPSFRFPGTALITACGLVWALALPSPAGAGTGFAESGPAQLDTRLPVIVLSNPPANTVLQGGQTIELAWTLTDDNPASGPQANRAEIWVGTILWESRSFGVGEGGFQWQWTAPDTSSATVHLRVYSADAFGNASSARGTDFTVLSTATGVPARPGALSFAAPAPNPFNPRTELRINLPEAGQVRVTVHDARGYLLHSLYEGAHPGGDLRLAWQGVDQAGRRQAAGAYFFHLTYRGPSSLRSLVRKAVLLP